LRKLIKKVEPFVLAAAGRILSSPRLRFAGRDPHDVVQQWWFIMLKGGFRGYDPARGPLFPYGYKSLARVCRLGTRGPRGKHTFQLLPDYADESKPSPPSGLKEKLGMRLYVAVRQLPFNYRRAILLKYLFEKTSEEGAGRCGVTVAKYNTWVYQGRLRLRETFKGYRWPDAA
jgi:DNA-directed RNA polymerase specialized sigma24 family protein